MAATESFKPRDGGHGAVTIRRELAYGEPNYLVETVGSAGARVGAHLSEEFGLAPGGDGRVLHERMACRLDYQIECDHNWRTRHARITGWVGESVISADIRVDSLHRWHLNGSECPQVKGCTDIDLNFSPSTNLLPFRRVNLAIGEEISVQAAWLRFPSFELELLPQIYRRVDQTTFQYQSAGGKFKTELQVNEDGFVIDYPGIWLEEN